MPGSDWYLYFDDDEGYHAQAVTGDPLSAIRWAWDLFDESSEATLGILHVAETHDLSTDGPVFRLWWFQLEEEEEVH